MPECIMVNDDNRFTSIYLWRGKFTQLLHSNKNPRREDSTMPHKCYTNAKHNLGLRFVGQSNNKAKTKEPFLISNKWA